MSEVTEIWSPIIGFQNKYEVSNYGNIRRLLGKRAKEQFKPIKYNITRLGYAKVYLYYGNNTGRKMYYVHQLVGEHFLPNPNHYVVINHKDENPLNNNADNLEWCTQKYNVSYGTANKRRSETLGTTIYKYTLDGELIGSWKSINEAAKENKISDSTINYAIRHSGISKGFRWSLNRI